ncbi:hypothetical protein OG883_23985 [Streptomyces sp. NBC_01142]|nr:hypothetical protein [Streptomyces sp. NBC_01142]MCX4822896.1 hypothetical protein [Streptomyces sp. NBC_01142]
MIGILTGELPHEALQGRPYSRVLGSVAEVPEPAETQLEGWT